MYGMVWYGMVWYGMVWRGMGVIVWCVYYVSPFACRQRGEGERWFMQLSLCFTHPSSWATKDRGNFKDILMKARLPATSAFCKMSWPTPFCVGVDKPRLISAFPIRLSFGACRTRPVLSTAACLTLNAQSGMRKMGPTSKSESPNVNPTQNVCTV